MQKDRFNQCVALFKRYYSGEMNEQEREEFLEMLKKQKLEGLFHTFNETDFLEEKIEEYKQFDAKKAFLKFSRQQKSMRYRRMGIWFSSAAAMILLLLGIGWLLNAPLSDLQTIAVVHDENILPGGHKAILRLANGETVNFDRDSMKVLEKNGTQISYVDGKISYQHTAEMDELAYNELTVPMAGECYITLEDNTKVWINAESRLKYPVKFTETERKVYVEGEAYFDVAKDGRPFYVATSQGEVAVLGTAFGVSTYTGKSEYTTLVRGSVRYTSKNGESALLTPGEQAVVDQTGKLFSRQVEVEEYVGWKDGIFVFRDKTLEEIMETLARWYGSKVVFENTDLQQLKYTGSLERYDSINTFLQVLEKLEDIHYEINDNTIVLYQKK